MDVPAPRFMEIPEVTLVTSLRKTSIYEAIARRELRPVKLGRKTVFLASEVFAFVNARAAARPTAAAD